MKSRNILLGACFVALCTMFGFKQVDQTTPESTLKAFVDAVAKADLKTAAGCVQGGKPDADFAEFAKNLKESGAKIELTEVKATASENKATASVTLKLSGTGQSDTQTGDVELVKADGRWLIVPPASMEMAATFVPQLAYALAHPAVFKEAKDNAKKAQCMSNARQLGMALIMLTADNDDVFKLNPNAWKAATMPYVKNEQMFHCPSDTTGGVSYSFNVNLLNKNLTSISSIAETVLLYEGAKQKLNFRHGGMAGVCFADGHVQMVNAEQAKKLRWKP